MGEDKKLSEREWVEGMTDEDVVRMAAFALNKAGEEHGVELPRLLADRLIMVLLQDINRKIATGALDAVRLVVGHSIPEPR
jgi:hypothetical protein